MNSVTKIKPCGQNEKVKVVHYRRIWLALTENWLFNQIKLLNNEIESHIICEKTQNLFQFKTKNIHQLPYYTILDKLHKIRTNWFKTHPYSRRLFKKVKEINPSLIHSHYGDFAWFEIPIAKKLGLAHIVTFYGHDVNRMPNVFPIWQDRYKELFCQIDKVLCEGFHMAKDIIKLGCPKKKIAVQHLGVPVERILFEPRKWESNTPLKFLIAGTFVEKKGIPNALYALGKINKSTPIEITIIGDARNDERSHIEKKKILRAISENGLMKNTRLLGYQPHSVLHEEAYKHHVFISPSITADDGDTEGGVPITIIEMAASGMPIVSTRHCDIPGVIIDGETGFLAQEDNIYDLTAKINTLIDQKNCWNNLLAKSRNHIEKEFNAKIQGIRLSKIYNDVLQEKALNSKAAQ
jgi:colanic acid/amylovoran biosynthesis glycosyltransferase